MNNSYSETEQWIGRRHRWLQDAASRIIQNNNDFSQQDIIELTDLCKAEAINAISNEFKKIEANTLSAKNSSTQLRLIEIKNIQGINALGPRNPLTFNGSLSIVYGQNGSGKSSYVRLLKHISGAKTAEKLLGNAFIDEQQPQQCIISIDENEETREILWTPETGTLNELRPLQLYDTDYANVYVNDENEVTYEPWILQFFSQLTNICLRVGQAIKQEMEGIRLTVLSPSKEMSKSKSILWFNELNTSTSKEHIESYCSWDENDENQLNIKRQQLAEKDPTEKIKQLRNTVTIYNDIHSLLKGVSATLSKEKCEEIIKAKVDYIIKRKATDDAAKKVFEGLPLDGVGTESWKLLWEQARRYSEQFAYPNEQFPFITSEANCVLCQQPLSSDAQKRLNNFETFIKDSLSKQAKSAEEHLNNLLDSLKDIPSESELALHFRLMDLTSEEQNQIINFVNILEKRKESLKEITSLDHKLPPLPSEEILIALNEVAASNMQQALSYESLVELDNKDELRDEILELEAQKWLHQNKFVISENVDKMKKISELKNAYSLTNTQALSTKKSSLSDELITSEYIKRFERELKELGGSRINVKLVKTRATKGQIYHQVQLKNGLKNVTTSEVLSEGELRLVSLAGFIADVESSSDNVPFIFDDPISSLDQLFEEATIKRIARLSLNRQVIVFTHRLSFLTLLQEAAKDMGLDYDVTWLRTESWGAGEPGEVPIFGKKPISALNQLLNERLSRARKILQEQGKAEYDLFAKGICSEFRILLERLIENDLLADVVQRFRRSITTQGKIHKLAKISIDDCKIFEELLTKYSKYEHSQSYETPTPLPEPDELKEDMESIKNWVTEFNKRRN
ncbi:hypothetical protein [Bacillus sp. AFS041924]|uniref:AAA family ATPase n=1 Tax=Bacillus sp. AFS041924 TaxID=2033503 RepID=UPI000BFCE8F6|nr:hypothetical protein [Bacillus sp. AFS041924]PGS49895.1 hypothetical protein COC46_14190 [Bacillus sp. AFS041924]